MSKQVKVPKDYNWTKNFKGRAPKYPWDKWVNKNKYGKTQVLVQGEDYEGSSDSLVSVMRTKICGMKLYARIRKEEIDGKECVVYEVNDKPYRNHKASSSRKKAAPRKKSTKSVKKTTK